jgi:hypothetical protein
VHGEDIAGLTVELGDDTGLGAGDLELSFVGGDFTQQLIDSHLVTNSDLPGHDFGLNNTFANLGQWIDKRHAVDLLVLYGSVCSGVDGV